MSLEGRSWIYLLAAIYCFALGTISYASFGSSASIIIEAFSISRF
jgi:hypothetical protein